MNPKCFRLVLIPAVLLLASAAWALDPSKSIFQYNCQNWSRQAGLPADKISAVTQSNDGYLWLGSQNGFIRFDGLEFKVVPIALPQAQGQDVKQMQLGPQGKLWFSINSGGYGSYDGTTFSAIPDPRWNAPGTNSNTIMTARDGAIWTGSVFGWGRYLPSARGDSYFDEQLGPVVAISEDRAGRVWIGTAEHGLYYWEHGQVKLFPDDELKTTSIHSFIQSEDGDLWVGSAIGLYRYDAQFHRKQVYFPKIQINSLLIDRRGVLWAGTNETGLGRFQDEKFSMLRKADGLGSDAITALFEDAEGSLWVGTEEGLSQLSDLKFPIFSFKEGLVSGGAVSVARSRKGGLWITTSTGASYFDGHTAVNYSGTALFENRYVRRVFEARNGDVYFGDGNKNIIVMRDGETIARYENEYWPEAFVEDATGVVVGIGPNLFRITNGKLEPFPFVDNAPFFDWFNGLSLANDGAIWAATNQGLFRIAGGKVQHWSTSNGLSADRVHFAFEDIDGAVWCGLPTGLVRIKDGTVTTISVDDGLSDARIFAMVADDLGSFWLASGRGILRVSRADLTAFCEGRSVHITCETFDGLESIKFIDRTDQGFAACKTADGRLWFPNPRGTVMIDPASYFTNQVPPRVHIEKIRVNSREVTNKPGVALEVGERSVDFSFSALSFIAPKKVRIQYRLEGFDSAWINAGARRSVAYNNLRPGHYAFQVQAANADGVWNTVGATYPLVLPPPFYERWWFYVLCALGIATSIFGGYRWKVRHMRRTQRQLQNMNELLETKVGQRTEELAKSVSLLNATLESVADGIVAIDRAGKVISYNTKFVNIWQFPPELLQQRDASLFRAFSAKMVAEPYVDLFLQRASENLTGANSDSFDVVELKDGRIFERYVAPQRIGGEQVGVVINWRDVTERRRAEAAAAEASALLDTLLQNTPDYIYFKDRESRFVRYSDAMGKRFGPAGADSLLGKTDFDVHPEALAKIARADEIQIMETGAGIIDKMESSCLPDGTMSWALTTKMPWRGPRGDIIGTFGVSRNLTAMKEAEAKLAYERDLLRSLLDSSPDQIYFKDVNSRFLKCSMAQAANFKVAHPDEMIGKTDFDFFTEEHARPAFEDEQRILRTGEPLVSKVEHETWTDGRETWVLTNKMLLRNGAGETIGTVGISKDITALKQAEKKLELANQQLVATSRQAGMAEVATSVLHNVGNVLNSVNVSATLVSDQVRDSKISYVVKVADLLNAQANDLAAFLTQDPKGQKVTAYLSSLSGELVLEQRKMIEELGHLRKNIEHIKEIVSMQQSFAKVSGITETIPIAELIEDAVRINSSSLTRHEVELVRDFRMQPVLVIERHKVMQILVNLIRNAKYACDESGRPDKKIVIRVAVTGDRVTTSVIDNGVGIPQDNLTRIFAHGFTTKKEGHGFGLHSGALAAKELGGTLVALSDGPGLGATFVLDLPLKPLAPSAP